MKKRKSIWDSTIAGFGIGVTLGILFMFILLEYCARVGSIFQRGERGMNELYDFESEEFGNVRIVTVDNEPMFCLPDVCRALGLIQP